MLVERSPVRRRRSSLIATVLWVAGALGAAAAMPAGAQRRHSAEPTNDVTATPPGLSVVWRIDGRKVDSRASSWSIAAFSADGKFVGVIDAGGTRIWRAHTGELVRRLPASIDPNAYSLAISSSEQVVIGRIGIVEFHDADPKQAPARFDCSGACGPVSAIAFSPDGSMLAYQAASQLRERREGRGSVGIVSVASGERVMQLDAAAARARVAFSPDGRTLTAANTTFVDDTETVGLRVWSTATWKLDRNVAGAKVTPGSVGPFASTDTAAAYEHDGKIEMRDIRANGLRWSMPLIPPQFDARSEGREMELNLVVFAPNAEFLLTYESPVSNVKATAPESVGTIVLRRADDGSVQAMYDVANVNALAISPDSTLFLYTTGFGRTALARVPR